MRRKLLRRSFVFSLVAVVILAWRAQGAPDAAAPVLQLPNGEAISLFIADTAVERAQGLGGRRALGRRAGMLFVFPDSDFHGIWMKDMQFPLDIVWLQKMWINADDISVHQPPSAFRVVDMKEHVATTTFPEIFIPKAHASYVLEMHAGVAERTGVRIGKTLVLRQQ